MTWAELHDKQRDERRAYIVAALQATNGNRTRAARAMAMDRNYLYRLIDDLAIDIPSAWPKRSAAMHDAERSAS